jgi:hypothetical protein
MKKPKNAGKAPSMQWYPADWRKDTAVQMLSFHDRGVWFELINIMHESAERGVLVINGAPMPEDALSRLLGLDKQTFNQTLSNLLTYGVAKQRSEDGAIYCKRMVEDEKLSQLRRNAGKLGGNPNLLNQNPTTPVNQNPTPSSSTSTSTSNNTPNPKEDDSFTPVEIAISAIHSSRTPKAFSPAERNALKELRSRITDDELIADAQAIKQAKDNGWEYFARTRPALLSKWEPQAESARGFRSGAKPSAKQDFSKFAF